MDLSDASKTTADVKGGILHVTMQPSPDLDAAVFDEWYNNEHGPTRLRMPDIFSSGVRYRAIDDSLPCFMALYDITRMSLLETKRYTSLRETRSSREASVVAKVNIHRLFWDCVLTRSDSTWKHDGAQPVTVSVEITLREDVEGAGELLETWFKEEHIKMLAKVPGWKRSRLLRASDKTTRYLALHDYAQENGLDGEAHHEAMTSKMLAEAVADKKQRTWALYYVFGAAARDLANLKRLPASAGVDDGRLRTTAGHDAAIESSIVTRDGLTIPYRLEGSGLCNAPVVAFSNSLLTSLHMWDPFIALLKRARPELQLLRYDTRGRHALPQPAKAADLARLCDDVMELLDALHISKLHAFVGVSMGGATALRLAVEEQSARRVGRIVAADCNAASTPANTQAWRERLVLGETSMAALAEQNVARWLHPNNRSNSKLATWLREMVAANNVDGFKHSCTALWDFDVRPQLPACKMPALLVVGEADAQGNMAKTMQAFSPMLGQEGAPLSILPETGHLPMCEDPEAFLSAVRDFI
ncbi:hypothetical protein CDD81_1527 [Ophiocordyceps australis]|uniref:AB hydrolase-1 domain-containing protein n=1 Tax=Ophiocordyceps australis TaxID=1399860 RepID=A0A2C5YEA1_9HYPO|nr:hypothetical protein CDD81_1527 [Ophiocordyceps australis]